MAKQLTTIQPARTSDILREQLESLLIHAEKQHPPCPDCRRLDAVALILMEPFDSPLRAKASAGR